MPTRIRSYRIPRARMRSSMQQLSRLFTERHNLETMADQWQEEIISTHVGRATGALQQQQRRMEKMFAQLLQGALKLNHLRVDSLASRSRPGGSGPALPRQVESLLQQGLTSALEPKTRTRTTVADSARSVAARQGEPLRRFRGGAGDAESALLQAQARSLRNQ